MIRAIPVMPRMKLRIRHGFVTPEQWRSSRLRLRPQMADAGDFALLTGARKMEVLALPWSDVDIEQRGASSTHDEDRTAARGSLCQPPRARRCGGAANG